MNIGIPDKNRKEVSKGLHKLLTESYALYLKTQNFHWNVVGSDFFSLHLLFEKHYEELSQALDEIAERIRALGHPVSLSFPSINTKASDANLMIEHLVTDHEDIIRSARTLAKAAERCQDQATVDLLARRLGAHEKAAWMLRSHLQ